MAKAEEKRPGRRYRGKTPLPSCVMKRACPTCKAVKGAPCFNPQNGIPWITDVHATRKDGVAK